MLTAFQHKRPLPLASYSVAFSILGGGFLIASMVFVIEKVTGTFGKLASMRKHCWTQLDGGKLFRSITSNVEAKFVCVVEQMKASL